jgi:long-chain acyl-CoA synthetase
MIVVSGFKVYPAEIEEVVGHLAGVEDCAAIGASDPATGEAVRLLVVRSDPALDEATVLRHCRANLTAYKCPKVVEFRGSLPKTPIGKVLKKELRGTVPLAEGEAARLARPDA